MANGPHSLKIVLRDTNDNLAKELTGITPIRVLGWIRNVDVGTTVLIEIDIIAWSK